MRLDDLVETECPADLDVQRARRDLLDQLGVRLLERSTRGLRVTDVGSEILEQARRGAVISEAVDHGSYYDLRIVGPLSAFAAVFVTVVWCPRTLRGRGGEIPDCRGQSACSRSVTGEA
jgi:DNA-binding transcriptional LysR family regulator